MASSHQNDCRYIHGFALSNYRSFGKEPQRLGPFSKINLFIGQNNCGKSNVLRFIRDYYPLLRDAVAGNSVFKLNGPDQPVGGEKNTSNLALGIRNDDGTHRRLGERMGGGDWHNFSKSIFDHEYFEKSTEMLWLPLGYLSLSEMNSELRDKRIKLARSHPIATLYRGLSGENGNDPERTVAAVDRLVGKAIIPEFSNIYLVHHTRKWGTKDFDDALNDGSDLVQRLARLHQASPRDHVGRAKWQALLKFFREVMGQPEGDLEVPFERDSVSVFLNKQGFSLDDLGTGIHEVIIIAALCIFRSNSVICIEEPELHQHPRLQRLILRFLDEHTSNQYFISTHSAHLLDHPGASVFHVRLTDKGTIVSQSLNPHHHSHVCYDLGYRASDLLQSNCVLWVEGPSDRLYIREWLRLHDSSLIEGIHYSIMFYGGRLLAHVGPNDPELDTLQELEDFISLRRINRNIVVVIDSDRRNRHSRVNATKRRIERQFQEAREDGGGGYVWITYGREVENYLPVTSLCAAIAKLGKSRKLTGNRFEDCSKQLNKVRLAREVIKIGLTLDVHDLRKHIVELANFIRAANHQPLPHS